MSVPLNQKQPPNANLLILTMDRMKPIHTRHEAPHLRSKSIPADVCTPLFTVPPSWS